MLRFLNWLGAWVYWIKHGEHCRCELNFGPWRMVDLGREKIRTCRGCGRLETTNHPWRGFLRRSR